MSEFDWGPVDLERTARQWAKKPYLDEEWCLGWAKRVADLATRAEGFNHATNAEMILTAILHCANERARLLKRVAEHQQ